MHEDVGIFPVYLMNLCGQIEEELEKLMDTEAGERMLELYFSVRSSWRSVTGSMTAT